MPAIFVHLIRHWARFATLLLPFFVDIGRFIVELPKRVEGALLDHPSV
jgi:hypothetical protein